MGDYPPKKEGESTILITLIALSFAFFLGLFTIIGVYSATRKKNTVEDYLLAGREVHPFFAALSAVATNNSGFMFIGMIGYTYTTGISSMWIMVGWILGDYMAWRWVYPRLRIESESREARTIPAYLAHTPEGKSRAVVVISAVIAFFFLGVYAAAQLNAGSRALHSLFGWDYRTGAIIGAAIVLLYSWSGGIRASIWTDVAQSIVMLFSMLLLAVVGVLDAGGVSRVVDSLRAIDPALLSLVPPNLEYGFPLFFLSWIFAGLGVAGQPHVVIRAMTIRTAAELGTARRIYFLWYTLFTVMTIVVGLLARVILNEGTHFDAELALPRISLQLLPPLLVGLVLAGLFAATMSTADSQVLSCSAAFSQDLLQTDGDRGYRYAKLGTIIVTLLTLGIALSGNESVFTLVVLSWSVLASSLGPLMILHSRRALVSAPVAIAMILTGFLTVLIWRYFLRLSDSIYEVMPGMAGGFLIYGVTRCMGETKKRIEPIA
jgi:sodium/proline symporter